MKEVVYLISAEYTLTAPEVIEWLKEKEVTKSEDEVTMQDFKACMRDLHADDDIDVIWNIESMRWK